MTGTRERILDSAQQLVLERGFAAMTVNAVLDAAHASKGAFFHHFSSKAHLGRTLVERYAAADEEALESAMSAAEAESDDPAEQLIGFIRVLEEGADAALETQPSCLFISFIYEQELDGANTDDLVAASIRLWRSRILAKLEAAAAQRPALAALDLEALADHVFAVLEGAFLLVRALGDRSAMRRQIAHLRHYLELLLAGANSGV